MARKPSIEKNQIMQIALQTFIKNGFEETTFNQIAKKLNISQPALYSYFDNKMDLMASCAIWAAETGRHYIDSQIDSRLPAKIRLRQYIKSNFVFFHGHSNEAFALCSVYFFAFTNANLKNVYSEIQNTSIDRIESVILQISYEENKKLKTPRKLAEMVHSLMVGEIYKTIYEPKIFNYKKREQLVMVTIEQLLKSNWVF